LNGIAVMRAYWSLFTGCRVGGSTKLPVSRTERAAILVIVAVIFAGGLFPQPWMTTRYEASRTILGEVGAAPKH
jgi:NADH-quinone oxidoreductase subunit M